MSVARANRAMAAAHGIWRSQSMSTIRFTCSRPWPWATAVGASFQLNQQWLLRAGYAYDPSPIRNADRSVRVPVGNRQVVTLGGAYSPSSDLTIDFAYGYLWDSKVSVKQSNNSGLQPEYSANYENSANGFSVQATYRY